MQIVRFVPHPSTVGLENPIPTFDFTDRIATVNPRSVYFTARVPNPLFGEIPGVFTSSLFTGTERVTPAENRQYEDRFFPSVTHDGYYPPPMPEPLRNFLEAFPEPLRTFLENLFGFGGGSGASVAASTFISQPTKRRYF